MLTSDRAGGVGDVHTVLSEALMPHRRVAADLELITVRLNNVATLNKVDL